LTAYLHIFASKYSFREFYSGVGQIPIFLKPLEMIEDEELSFTPNFWANIECNAGVGIWQISLRELMYNAFPSLGGS
jgi:hypothetical protein